MMKKLLLNLGFALLASVTAMAQSTEDAITDVVITPATLVPGQDATVTFNYEFSSPGPGAFIVVMGEAEEAAETFADWGAAAGIGGWSNQGGTITQTTGSTAFTMTFKVPASVPTTETAALSGNVIKMLIRMKEDASDNESGVVNSWNIVTVGAADESGSIANISIPEKAEIGSSFEAIVEYTHNYAENQTLKAFLVKGLVGGDLLWDKGTFGYSEVSLAPGEAMTEVITFNVPLLNDNSVETTPTSGLEEGEEWRLVVQAFDLDKGNNPIIIEGTDNIINSILITSSPIEGLRSNTISIDYEYTAIKDAQIELAVILYKDAFTPVGTGSESDPFTLASNDLFIIDLAASTVPGEKTTGTATLTINANAAKSTEIGTNQWRVVAKLLDPSATSTYIMENSKSILIRQTTGVFGSIDNASFTAFPNPVSGNSVNFSKEISNVVVYDFTGNVVATQASATSFETNNLKSGIYMISSDQGTLKVVVE